MNLLLMSNKDYLQFFHNLHNLCRNGDIALTGMSALNEINNFILFIFMEPNIKKYKLSNKCSFSNFYEKYIEPYLKNKEYQNIEHLEIIINNFTSFLEEVCTNENTKTYFLADSSRLSAFYSEAGKDHNTVDKMEKFIGVCKNLVEIIIKCKEFFYGSKSIKKYKNDHFIKKINFDLLGDAYEKFKENEVGGKDNGQFFTPRSIIEWIVNNMVISPNKSIYDSSCGTGGFMHYLVKKADNEFNEEEIKKFKSNIYGNDKTDSVIKPLYINMFLHQIPIENIRHINSLSKYNCESYLEKFDYVIGNPPFGINNNIEFRDFDIKINGKFYNYWPKFIHQKNLITKTSMCQFIIHTINSLKKNGDISLITDRGILNNGTNVNGWQKNLRKWMCHILDLKKIILIPKGAFTHTTFDTAIYMGTKKLEFTQYANIETSNHKKFYYANNDLFKTHPDKIPTQKIEFYKAKFENEKDKIGFIVDDKPNITITIKDLINKDWSLNIEDYIEKKEELIDGVEYKTIIELFNFYKSKRKAKDMKENGKYVFFNSSQIPKKSDYNDFEGEYIVLPNGGSAAVHYINNKFSCSADNFILENKTKNNTKYMFYILLTYKNILNDNFTGNGLKHLTKTNLEKIKIPIVKRDHQERIVENIERIFRGSHEDYDNLVKSYNNIDFFNFLLNENFNDIEKLRVLEKTNHLSTITELQEYINTLNELLKISGKSNKLSELINIIVDNNNKILKQNQEKKTKNDSESEQEESDEDELEEVEYKNKKYLSDGKNFYRIRSNGEAGKLVWIKKNGKMKSVKNQENKTINL